MVSNATSHPLRGFVSTTYTLLLCETVHTCILSEIAFQPTSSETCSAILEMNSEIILDPYVWHRLGEDPMRLRTRDGDQASPDGVLSLSDVPLPAGITRVRGKSVVVGASALRGECVVVYTLQALGPYTSFSLQCILSNTVGLP